MKLYLSPVHLFLANKRKKDHNPGPYLGYAYTVPRVRLPEVRGRIYRPAKGGEALPVLFNIHGGSWIFGDAEGVDLQSQYLANHLECMVVNIDYRLLDEYPFPYQQTEVADTVEYFLARADEYHILRDHAAVAGYSAGGHICAGAAMLLRDRGVKIRTQVLCYPFLNYVNFSLASYVNLTGTRAKALNGLADKVLFEKMPKESVLLSPANADPADLKGLADAVIVTSGAGDPLLPQGEAYAEKLRAAGVSTVYKEYEKAVHGFLERNFRDDPAVFANEDPQDALMRQAVDFIKEQDIFRLKG
ncbi:MAG: alpha/beta hydrolase [Clostridia bacterium]|nr:alpha/beta hydrolase [Clostridia bacterium]